MQKLIRLKSFLEDTYSGRAILAISLLSFAIGAKLLFN